jgi:AcrR family transcriptional regulator
MRRRGEMVDATRRRITEAAVRLHTSVGPSRTSMSAVAEEAGITRLTLYRHFPSKDALFGACMSHWRRLHPPPDLAGWRSVTPFSRRVGVALRELYRWYDENGDDLYPIYRDAAMTPASTQQARRANSDAMADAVLEAFAGPANRRRSVRAALGHAVNYWTWRSLSVEQRLTSGEAAAMAAGFVLAAASRRTPSR